MIVAVDLSLDLGPRQIILGLIEAHVPSTQRMSSDILTVTVKCQKLRTYFLLTSRSLLFVDDEHHFELFQAMIPQPDLNHDFAHLRL